MTLQAGRTLGHYEVLSSLGAGGMGEVYRARDTRLGREVARRTATAARNRGTSSGQRRVYDLAMVPVRVNLWSGPRNVSTALMYSFAQRADTVVVDEPLYAHYLRVSGARHPGREEVLLSQDQDGAKVVREVILSGCDRGVHFFKQMAHHLVELDRSFLARCANVILTRDPRDMLPSLTRHLPEATLRDTGYAMLTELHQGLRRIGQDPPVLDARELLLDPRGVLSTLCDRLGIPFDEAMLSWEPGPRPEDGVWARHWYDGVHRSTGFEPYHDRRAPLDERSSALLAECQPHYEPLRALAIEARAPERRASS